MMKMLIFSSFKIFYMRFFFPRFHLFLSLGKYFKAKSEYFIIYLFVNIYLFGCIESYLQHTWSALCHEGSFMTLCRLLSSCEMRAPESVAATQRA